MATLPKTNLLTTFGTRSRVLDWSTTVAKAGDHCCCRAARNSRCLSRRLESERIARFLPSLVVTFQRNFTNTITLLQQLDFSNGITFVSQTLTETMGSSAMQENRKAKIANAKIQVDPREARHGKFESSALPLESFTPTNFACG